MTPAGTSSSPCTMPIRSTRSAEASGAVAASFTGRVCGAGAGKAPRPTTIRTRHDLASPDHGVGEGPPVEVGLGPDEIQHVGPRGVLPVPDDGLGPGQLGRHAVDDVGHRPAGPLVEEVLAVEGDQGRRGALPQQRGDGGGGAQPGVDPPLERDDQDGPVERGLAVGREDLGHAVGAHGVASSASEAIWARAATWAG